MKRQFITTLVILTLVVSIIFYDQVSQAIIILAYTVAGFLIISILLLTVLLAGYVLEKMKMFRARRIEAEKRAHVMTVIAGNQVFVRDTDHRANWHAMHLEARTYISRKYGQPSTLEIQQWQLFNSPPRGQSKSVQLLPPPPQVDLLAVLDIAQCALIVGQRDSGKTTILQHVISRRLGKAYVLVLDPHSHPTRWPQGCKVIGTERDFAKIENALKGLLALMNKRYREIGKGLVGEGEHEPVTVIIDEWRAIVHQLGKPAADIIKTLLAESRKTNIDVFIGTHSERVKALGIEGEGDLKEGFVMVRLTINKMTGERKATVDYGDGEIPATLPGPFVDSQPQAFGSGEFINLEAEPTPTEAQILSLYEQGESYNEIARQVFGHTGGKQTQKIKEIIAKFNDV